MFALTRVQVATALNSSAGPLVPTFSTGTTIGNLIIITVGGNANSPGNLWNGNIVISDGHHTYNLVGVPVLFIGAFGVDYAEMYLAVVTNSITAITVSWSMGTFQTGSPFIIAAEYKPASDVVIYGNTRIGNFGSQGVLNGSFGHATGAIGGNFGFGNYGVGDLMFSTTGGQKVQIVAVSPSNLMGTIVGALYQASGVNVWTSNGSIAATLSHTPDNGTLAVADLNFILGPSAPVQIDCTATQGMTGIAYDYTFPVLGGTAPFTFSIISGSLPPGLTLNTSTGEVTGTPTTAGTYNFTIKVVDDNGNCSQTPCSIIIIQCSQSGSGNYAYYARS